MPVTSGKGRLLNGSGGDRVKRNNLTEFRGAGWEMNTDWFFGVHSVSYEWRDAGDAAKVDRWIYTQDDDYTATAAVNLATHRIEIDAESANDPGGGLSNQRDLYTIPETGTWGIAHAMVEIGPPPAFTNSVDVPPFVQIKPQHGLGLRAQEDNGRDRKSVV